MAVMILKELRFYTVVSHSRKQLPETKTFIYYIYFKITVCHKEINANTHHTVAGNSFGREKASTQMICCATGSQINSK